MTLVANLGNFVSELNIENLPSEVVQKAKINLLHGLGVALAGVKTEFAPIARAAVEMEINPGAPSTILLDGSKALPMGAAFVNAVLSHSRTQEDTHGTTHCGPIIIPATLALAEQFNITGRELVEALVAGYELAATMGKRHTALSTPHGFRASSIYGIFGATAAAGKVLKLNPEQMANAFAYAASFAFGTTEAFNAGTMEWRFEVGLAARNGILCALLCKNGAVGAPTALEGSAGFYAAFAGTRDNLEEVTRDLGRVWEILNVDLKPYPVCAFNQTPVTAMIELANASNLQAEEIAGVTIKMCPYEANYPGMAAKGPFNSIGGTLMSTPYCLAVSIVDRNVTLENLQRYDDPVLADLVAKTEVVADASLQPLCCRIEVVKKNGEKLTKAMDAAADQYRYTWDQEIELVNRMARDMQISASQLDRLIQTVGEMEKLNSTRELVGIIY